MKKIFALMFCMVLLIGFASAGTVKNYNSQTKTVDIKSHIWIDVFGWFDSPLLNASLETPQIYKVPVGYQKVAQFTINPSQDINDVIQGFQLINNKNGQKISRQIDVKYLTYETVSNYVQTCTTHIDVNGSSYPKCSQVQDGTKQQEKWLSFNNSIRQRGRVTIGLFTTVKIGDNIEWIPTIAGEKVSEWASWSAYFDSFDRANSGTVGNGWTETEPTGSLNITNNNFVGQHGTGASPNMVKSFLANATNVTNVTIRTKGNSFTVASNIALRFYLQDSGGGSSIVTSIYGGTFWKELTINPLKVGLVDNTYYNITFANINYTSFTYDVWFNGVLINSSLTFTNNLSIERIQVYTTEGITNIDWITFSKTNPNNIPINLLSPINNYNSTSSDINFSINVSDPNLEGINNVSLLIDGVINSTNVSGYATPYNFSAINIPDGNHNWSAIVYNSSNWKYTSSARNFSIDTVAPTINITYPFPNDTYLNYHAANTNLQFNWTALDTHLDSCWIQYNSSNNSVTCSTNTTNINITNRNLNNATLWVNDTVGNYAHKYWKWKYRLFQESESYINQTFEGISNAFSVNFYTNGSTITAANLTYNNTQYAGVISNHGGNNFTISKSITAPIVNVNTNISFFWNISQGSLYYNITPKNQTVINLGVDDCSVNKVILYNFTSVDEENEIQLGNVTAKLNLQLYSYGSSSVLSSYNKSASTNPFAICLNQTLSGTNKLTNDLQLQYVSPNHAEELYYIQNATLNSSTFNQNITLYDLNSSKSQIFTIIFRDSSFLPVQDALINVYRKYVDQSSYKVVEIPKTDAQGEAVAHLQLNNAIYKFVITKYGETLKTITDVIPVCQTPLVSECTMDLNAFSEAVNLPDFESANDFNFTLGYDNSTRTITSVFVIPSGSVDVVSLNVTQTDTLGTSVCSDQLTSPSGTLSCVVPISFGNSTVKAEIYKSGSVIAQGGINTNPTPSQIYGVTLIGISLFLLLTLIGVSISGNPIITTILLMLGVIFLFALNLTANSVFIGSTATILWLVIAVILIAIKGGRRS